MVVRNHVFDAFLKEVLSLVGKMGVAATVALRSPGPQDPTKKLAHWVDLFGQLLSGKNVFEIFGP